MTTDAAIRYFVVSPFKTGTTSVERALLQIGAGKRAMPYRQGLLREFRSRLYDHRVSARLADDFAAYRADHGNGVLTDLDALRAKAEKFDVFADAPLGHGHVHPFALRILFPSARFIWVERRFKDWIASVEAWEVARPDLYKNAHLWQSAPEKRTEALRRMRRRRLQALKSAEAAFPADCLRIDLHSDQAMADLASFCGLPDPGAPLPHANANR